MWSSKATIIVDPYNAGVIIADNLGFVQVCSCSHLFGKMFPNFLSSIHRYFSTVAVHFSIIIHIV